MKDIIIKGTTLRRELLWLLACFVAAFLVNTYAVVHFDRPAVELFSQLGCVVVITACFYIVLAIVRILLMLISIPFRKKQKKIINQ